MHEGLCNAETDKVVAFGANAPLSIQIAAGEIVPKGLASPFAAIAAIPKWSVCAIGQALQIGALFGNVG